MATVEVILKQKIEGLGAEADVVKVKSGFARNFLVPQGRAYEATKGNLRQIENLKAARAKREADELTHAEAIANKLKKVRVKLTLNTGQGGKAFGSITTKDIAEEITKLAPKLKIDRHQLVLDKPIKGTGKFDVPVKLHPDVESTVKVNVESANEEPAAEQAKEG